LRFNWVNMCETELDYFQWIEKISEKLTFILLNIKDHRDIKETDYDLLKILFKPYYNGEYPLFITKMEGEACQSVTQTNLFTQESKSNTIGTDVVIESTESKTDRQ
jgi:hypothetical protein